MSEGEFVCLLGPSGCGKSTLLDIMAGLTKPESGQVLADGQRVTGPGQQRLVMFQEPALFPWLDVMGNVLFGLKTETPGRTNHQRREIAVHHLGLVGLEKFQHAYVHELSGGMKQRVALARSLAPDPQVLLMDEPLAALDALTRDQLYDDIQRIWQESRKTIVSVTHNVREAVCLGDRVVLMATRFRGASFGSSIFRCRVRATSTALNWRAMPRRLRRSTRLPAPERPRRHRSHPPPRSRNRRLRGLPGRRGSRGRLVTGTHHLELTRSVAAL